MFVKEPLPFEIIPVLWNNPDAERLRKMQREEFNLRYPQDPGEPGVRPSQGDCLLFLLIRQKVDLNDESKEYRYVGAGGLRKVDKERIEVKRMFILPEFRGQTYRLADRLISALEHHALQLGFKTLLVETGTFVQQARRFYSRVGFQSCPAFPPYDKKGEAPQSIFLKKEIEMLSKNALRCA